MFSPYTDILAKVDALGDILVASGDNAFKKLTLGTANQVLSVNAGGTDLEYSTPAAIPTNVSAFTNDAGYQLATDVTAAVNAVVDAAPGTLDTLNELAAALGDDPNYATTTAAAIAAKADATRSLTGTDSVTGGGDLSADSTFSLVGDAAAPGNSFYYGTDATGTKGFFALPVGATNLAVGTVTATTLEVTSSTGDNVVLPAATTTAAGLMVAADKVALDAAVADVADLTTLTGVASNASDLGTFTGTTITDASDIKTALQELETAVENNNDPNAVVAWVIPDGSNTVSVAHGIAGTPTIADVEGVVYTNLLGNAVKVAVTAIDGTNVTLTADVDPGADTATGNVTIKV